MTQNTVSYLAIALAANKSTGATGPIKENHMKPSHYITPRNYADCTWVQGYGRKASVWPGYALAFAIGVGLAALLVAWWSS